MKDLTRVVLNCEHSSFQCIITLKNQEESPIFLVEILNVAEVIVACVAIAHIFRNVRCSPGIGVRDKTLSVFTNKHVFLCLNVLQFKTWAKEISLAETFFSTVKHPKSEE